MEKKPTKKPVKKAAKKESAKPVKKITPKKSVKKLNGVESGIAYAVDPAEQDRLWIDIMEPIEPPRSIYISLSWLYLKMYIKSFFSKK